MSEDLENELKELFGDGSIPSLESVRSLRRKIATDPARAAQAETLMKIEKRLEAGREDIGGLIADFPVETGENKKRFMKMNPDEPFPDQRFRLLKRSVEEAGGVLEEKESSIAQITIPVDADEHRILALNHWNRVDEETF